MAQLPNIPIPTEATDDDVAQLDNPTPEVEEEFEELPDGSVNIKAPKKKGRKDSTFDENLAETLETRDLNMLGIDMCERIEGDIESRKERDKQYAEGIRRTGVGGEAPGGADFDGASKVVHPMLAKGCVDFASKAIKELYPATGPCKTQIIGKSNEAKLARAERKKTYVNWQLMTRVEENRAQFERLLSQLPLGGSVYKRWWHERSRLRTETVYVDDVFLPYNAEDFYSAPRVTHRQYISKATFEARVDSGLYADVVVSAPPHGTIPDKSDSRTAAEKAEGVEEDSGCYNEEGLREIYMIYADLSLDDVDDGEMRPYILHLDAHGHKVLGLYRNWAEDDDDCAKKHWMVEYIFIPWRGPMGLGLAHLIGSMAAAATGALRALLDSAHIQNFPGGLKLKSGRTAGQSLSVNATELQEIDCPPGIDDIRKIVMPFPFNGPSTVLQALLEWLTGQAEQIVAVASEKIAEGGANMPMGTALALIEQGSVNFSAIHSRLHASLKKELEIVHRLNAEYMEDEETIEELGELVVSRADFQGPNDIIPVSDPNIFSEAQRYAQMQAVLQLAASPQFAPLFPPDKVLRRVLKLLQVQDIDDITHLPKEPERLSATDENYAVCAPDVTPLKVYDEQDDVSHLMCHTHFLTSPMFGANPLIAPQAALPLLQHCKDHLMAFYRKHAKAATQAMMTVAQARGMQITQDQAEAHGTAFADQIMAQALGPMVMPALTQAFQQAQQYMPKPQADANTQLAEQTKTQIAQAQIASAEKLKGQELAAQAQSDEADRAANQHATEAAAAQAEAALQSKENTTAMMEGNKHISVTMQAHIDAIMEQAKTQREEEAAARAGELQVIVQMMKDQGAQQLLVLQAMLGTATSAGSGETTADGSAAPAGPKPLKIQGTQDVIAMLMKSMADNNQMLMSKLGDATQAQSDMLGQLAQGMQALHAAQAAPRAVEFIRDQRGKATGARTTIQGNQS